MDITCYYNGFHGDLNETVFVGDVDEASKNLVKTAYECMMAAVNESKASFSLKTPAKEERERLRGE